LQSARLDAASGTSWRGWPMLRQFRTPASMVFSAVVALVVVLAVTGLQLFDTYNANKSGLLSALQFSRFDQALYNVGLVALYVAPPVIGAFWGAPLVARELEAGTHRLVWNQSITRNRWLATKLVVTGLSSVAAVGLLSLAVTWWSSPIDHEVGIGNGAGMFNLPRLAPVLFGARGIVPVGYTVFAFALGVTVGLVLRRSVFAVAVTLAAVVAVQVAMPLVVRSHLLAPERLVTAITTSNMNGLHGSGSPDHITVRGFSVRAGQPGDWMLSNRTVDATGEVVDSLPAWVADCALAPPGVSRAEAPPALEACFTRLVDDGYRQLVTYQPASRFWALQWRETAILVTLALLLTGFCFQRIRRNLS
jgi:hypothetical protein